MIRWPRMPKVMTHVGFWLAMLVWIVLGWQLAEHFFFRGDFTVLATYQECEQPLNNRCSPVYRLRERDGDEHMETLRSFLGEVAVGSHIQKDRFAMSYWVNGHREAMGINGSWLLALLLALLSFGNAVYWASRRKRT